MDSNERRKRAAEEAAEWWVLLLGDVSRAQREQYVKWLRESPLHVAEMLYVAHVHGAVRQFERWDRIPTDTGEDSQSEIVTFHPTDRPESPAPDRAIRSPRRSRFLAAIAASLLVIASAGALLKYFSAGQQIQTGPGERRQIQLADGSVVQMDPETLMRVQYEKRFRRVYLEEGRALFHVAKNVERPFLVRAYGTTVRAVGTAFAVEEGTSDVVVTVAEGKVAVLPAQQPQPAVIDGPAAPSIFLTADEQVTVSDSGRAQPVRRVDSRRALAWAEGLLIFENDSVEYVVRQFNRYNRVQLRVSDPVLARRTISGVFSATDPESFVAFMQSVAAVRVTRDDASKITIGGTK